MKPKSLAITALVALIAAGIAWAGSQNSQTLNGIPLFALAVGAAFVVQWVAFVPANIAKTEKYFDLIGSSTYFSITLLLLILVPQRSVSGVTIALCIMAWSARLGTFLFRRVGRAGKDGRFDEIKQDSMRFFNVWHIQGLWVTFTASAGWVGITSANYTGTTLQLVLAVLGLVVWALGFVVEVTADNQKSSFNANPENKGNFINQGLWTISRHPNYFGEITLWCGIAVIALPLMSGWQYVALLSPVFVYVLLSRISGVPLLEKRSDAKWGGNSDYETYKANTPVLFPRFGAISSKNDPS